MALDRDENASSRSQSESSDDSDSQDSDDMRTPTTDSKGDLSARKPNDDKVKKAANKDPNRVKRKKARRACENCQRAHLTCSDKRPCERCGDKKICKDGKRKKAKYLADAPDEDLTPGQDQVKDSHFANFSNDWHGGPPFPRSSFPSPGVGSLYASQNPTYPLFVTHGQQNQMPFQPYSSQQMSMGQSYPLGPHQQPILPDYSRTVQQPNTLGFSNPNQDLSVGEFYPNPNTEENSFANQYGYGELAYITHLTSGMADTPPSESTGTLNPSDDANFVPGVNTPGYGSAAQPYGYPQDQVIHNSRPSSREEADPFNLRGQDEDSLDGLVKQEEPTGYPIGAYNNYPSPSFSGSSPQGMTAGIDESPSVKSMYTNINPSRQAQLRETLRPMTSSQQQQNSSQASPSTPTVQTATIPSSIQIQPSTSNRRHRKPSMIYNAVTEPYSYTKAFHDLMALIRKRFSPSKTARIAKALASIRPSFISSLTKLDDDDRVFMEKCLQRTLLEYDDFLSATGTPTIICRRTGEVVAVGEGFSVLTGWRKAVLLGREPNLNVNKGGDTSGPSGMGTATSRDNITPRVSDSSRPDPLDESRQNPVSIVELLDDESACDFFDDYSHLAFGDSRGSVTTPCKLLKYKTARDAEFDKTLDSEAGSRLKRQRDATRSGKDGNAGMTQIGDDDGKVECMLCWSVKRDVFDIPMLFVMNVLPCI
ncbi:hypothetical protein HO133_007903 [Letharia lupina]|uniref:ERT1/acuK family PAS domain-containing protein n=1 Tax=Letharia lupina TaxID=560253 RepID=A0A8H6CRD1_9LECA|nr:uncharacterized protein HO133_007903 [Letharia lupina]KAF6228173.1 hypothetical protein HO133_007903 [Letharia lupina]